MQFERRTTTVFLCVNACADSCRFRQLLCTRRAGAAVLRRGFLCSRFVVRLRIYRDLFHSVFRTTGGIQVVYSPGMCGLPGRE